MNEELQDWCRLLGVSRDASVSEVKRAYRKKVKECHPDLNPSPQAHRQMQALVKAYEGLVAWLREFHELREEFRNQEIREEFDFRTFLRERKDPESKARLIFYEMLHNGEDEAVRIFLELGIQQEEVMTCFDREDYMDCAFMLAEELQLRNHPDIALDLLFEISRLEIKKPYFHFFFDDIKELIRATILSLVAGAGNTMPLVQVERFIHMDMGSHEQAWYFRILAELCIRRNQAERGLLYLEECRRIDPKIKGIKELLVQIQKIMERNT